MRSRDLCLPVSQVGSVGRVAAQYSVPRTRVNCTLVLKRPGPWEVLGEHAGRHGPKVIDVPVDGEGMVTSVARERLEELKKQGKRRKLIYTIVNFQNPAGSDADAEAPRGAGRARA